MFSLLWLWLLLCGVGSIPGPGIPTYCLCGKKEKKIQNKNKNKAKQNKREPEINVATLIKKKKCYFLLNVNQLMAESLRGKDDDIRQDQGIHLTSKG